MLRLLRDAGLPARSRQRVDRQPPQKGIFATLDAGAPRTIGL
jgi:hypothetical protein